MLMKLSLATNVFESLEDLFGSFSFSYDLLFRLLITVLIIYIICSLFNMIIEIIPVHNNRIRTMLAIFRSFVNYAAVIFAICFGLNIIGIDVSTIVASLGIVALVIGFGAESLIEDVITGLFMIA
ncbi:MAG: mechanosensitive ion channel [Solobacterium sp.]|nr:mechanosensitive ion channel [Solobacterium sp.]